MNRLGIDMRKHYVKCKMCRHYEYIHSDVGCEFLYYDEVEGSRGCNCLKYVGLDKELKIYDN